MKGRHGLLKALVAGLLIWGWQGGAGLLAGEDAVKRIELVIAERKLARESNRVRVTQGETVELVWMSDESVELHLHGYDIALKLHPDRPAVMALMAHATGRFPITSHGFGKQAHGHETLLYLEVYPGE